MLEKIYSNKSEKEIRTLYVIYIALLIVSIIMPILLSIFGFYLTGNTHLSNFWPFIVILFWSSLNVDYLKKKLNSKN